MKDHTTIGHCYMDGDKFINEKWPVYYNDYPPPDGYENMSPVAKSADTRKEWEEYWRERKENEQFTKLKIKMQLGRWHRR